MLILPVILCGGSGTRLWPLSRRAYPKQFQPSPAGVHSLFQDTALRVAPSAGIAAPMVVTGDDYRFLVAEQLRQAGIRPSEIVLEPCARNTAPAIAAAAWVALQRDPQAILLVVPSDHYMAAPEAFTSLLPAAADAAQAGRLVAFGAAAVEPHTGYGYIQRGAPLPGGAFEVVRFVEKPDRATAQRLLAEGGYEWNCGIFMFRADRLLQELERFRPEIAAASRAAVDAAARDLDFLRLDAEAFARCPTDSIDYAVMERTSHAAVLPMSAGWSDVGSWAAMAAITGRDASGNAVRGDVVLSDVRGSFVRAESRLVAALGVDNLVIVETADAVLVANQSRAEEVRGLVAQLSDRQHGAALEHTRVYRPWGHFEQLDEGQNFKVKRIVLNPGAAISLQRHRQRAEHWIVVRGDATVTRGDEQFGLRENESTFIPVGVVHRLENRGEAPLEIIEVQSGPYLGEDDIERFQDAYGRR